MITTSLIPSCGPCCGATACHCCDHIDLGSGAGYFQQWDITFNSSAPSPFTSTTVRVYKVAGEPFPDSLSRCKWESEDGLVRVFMFGGGENLYSYTLYADGNDDDLDYTYRSPFGEFESSLFTDAYWCREESNENAFEDCDDAYIDAGGVVPVSGTWVGCIGE